MTGMREKSLLLEGASEVVLSFEEEGFLLRLFGLLGLMEESVEVLLMGRSLREGRSLWTRKGEGNVITEGTEEHLVR